MVYAMHIYTAREDKSLWSMDNKNNVSLFPQKYVPTREVFQNLTKLQDTNLSKILKEKKKELQKELNDLSIQLFS